MTAGDPAGSLVTLQTGLGEIGLERPVEIDHSAVGEPEHEICDHRLEPGLRTNRTWNVRVLPHGNTTSRRSPKADPHRP